MKQARWGSSVIDRLTPAEAWRQISAALDGVSHEPASQIVQECCAAVAGNETVGRGLLTELLRCGKWSATGYASPDMPATKIPAHHWHFMSLDIECATAAAPQHGLAYVGMLVSCMSTAMPVLRTLTRGPYRASCAPWGREGVSAISRLPLMKIGGSLWGLTLAGRYRASFV